MKIDDVSAEDLLVEVDGVGVHPESVDPLSLLRLATAYVDLLKQVAEDQGVALVLTGLWLEDKCAAVRTRAASADTLSGPVRECEKYLSGAPTPWGVKGRIGNLYKAIQSLPPGLVASVRAGQIHFRLSGPEDQEGQTPWAKTKLWVRPKEIGGNGVLDHVTLESTSEPAPFSLRIAADKARQLGPYLHHPVLAEMLVVRGVDGKIDDGRVTDFVAPNIPQGEGLDAWRKWVKDNVDTDATLEELGSKD